jgi:flavorubredoxin
MTPAKLRNPDADAVHQTRGFLLGESKKTNRTMTPMASMMMSTETQAMSASMCLAAGSGCSSKGNPKHVEEELALVVLSRQQRAKVVIHWQGSGISVR